MTDRDFVESNIQLDLKRKPLYGGPYPELIFRDVKGRFFGEYLPMLEDSRWSGKDKNLILDFMMIGPHMFEDRPGKYSFELTSSEKNEREHIGCMNAMIQGIESGLFDIVAHPDRCFKRQKEWTDDMAKMSRLLINAANETG